MTREQAINYLICRGITEYRVNEIVRALTYEPITKNDLGVDAVSRQEVLDLIADYDLSMGQVVKGIHALPSVTPQLSVPEVTALAEWIEKLTKASEDAYNKGYADGVKSVNICPHCGEYIGEEE